MLPVSRIRSSNVRRTKSSALHRQFRHRRGAKFWAVPFDSGLKQNPSAQVNPSVSLRSTAPFTQGSLFLNFTNALLFHTGAAQKPSVGATLAAVRFPGFRPCPTRAAGSALRSKKAPPWGELPPEAAEGGTTALKASAAGTKGPVRSPAAGLILRCCRRPPSASLRSAPPPEGEAFTQKRSGKNPGAFSLWGFT